mmetsp:Transcript_8770/g.9958  ORF Transcript_8770/g.9958 Transcript_8770/m.9958 type:complete len:169 (-) Transcript_8770:39-545(-)
MNQYCWCLPLEARQLLEPKACFSGPQRTEGHKIQRKTNDRKKLLLEQRIQNKMPTIFKSLEMICDEDTILIHGKPKLAPRRNSVRRSRYIGVFKNGPNWQALIAIDKKKTYIGTYETELEAAMYFDLISILINGLTALTNFSYSKKDIMRLASTHYEEVVSKTLNGRC